MSKIEITSKIVFLLEKICQAHKHYLWQIAYKEGLTPTQIEILQIVASYPQSTVSHIAKELGVSKPTASEAIKALIEKDVLQAQNNFSDKRKKILILTKKGRRIAKKTEKLNILFLNSTKKLSLSQRKNLYKSLLFIVKILHEEGMFKLIRFCPFCANRKDSPQPICIITNRPVSPENFRPNCPHFKEIN